MIDEIQNKIENDEFEFSRHALDQSILRRVTVQEVREAVSAAEIVEDYPDDKYGPSCLLLGFTSTERPLHIQCSYPTRSLVKIVTLYEPAADLWIDFKTRSN